MKKLLGFVLILIMLINTTACGYLFYPERRSQYVGSGSKLDLTVMVADAVGLAFFVIPGLIAFAIDIASNTIYLPAGERVEARRIELGSNSTKYEIERVLFEEYGVAVELERDAVSFGI